MPEPNNRRTPANSPPLAPAATPLAALAQRLASIADRESNVGKPKRARAALAMVRALAVAGKPPSPSSGDRCEADSRSRFGTLLTPEEIVQRLRGQVTIATLRNWRSLAGADGPPWLKVGRGILYPERLFDLWLQQRLSYDLSTTATDGRGDDY
jgi:hypothetical protein